MGKNKNALILTKDNIPDFNDIDITVSTIIVISNFDIDLEMLFLYCPMTDYTIIKKKRGRKKKSDVPIVPIMLPPGSVISAQMENNKRGVVLKVKKPKKSKRSHFLNSVTLVIIVDNNKQINVKISNRGKFQITGCKTEKHYIDTMKYIYEVLNIIEVYVGHPIYRFVDLDKSKKSIKQIVDHPILIFSKAMNNKDYAVNFNLDREKLTSFLNKNTEFMAEFDGSMDTGVNIKLPNNTPFDEDLLRVDLPSLKDDDLFSKGSDDKSYSKDDTNESDDKSYSKDIKDNEENSYSKEQHQKKSYITVISSIKYDTVQNMLEEKDRHKIEKKIDSKYHTIMAFHSGSFIQSGRGPEMKDVYEKFVSIIFKHQSEFKDDIKIEEKFATINMCDISSGKSKNKKYITTKFKYIKSLKKLITFIKTDHYKDINIRISMYKKVDGVKHLLKSNRDYHDALMENDDIFVDVK